jgi:cystathionine beta-lyase family protein involved in aluminum resistance
MDKLELVSIFQKSDHLLKIVGIGYNTTYAMLNIDESHKKTKINFL